MQVYPYQILWLRKSFFLRLAGHHGMTTYEGAEAYLHEFLTLAALPQEI
jgi:hypothetical protein